MYQLGYLFIRDNLSYEKKNITDIKNQTKSQTVIPTKEKPNFPKHLTHCISTPLFLHTYTPPGGYVS